MKITKRQLRRIINEEKQKLIKEQPGRPARMDGLSHDSPHVTNSPMHMSGRNQSAMEQLHTAIDNMIEEMGRDVAQMELQGIVDEWDQNSYPEHPDGNMMETDDLSAMDEGTELDNMPDSWRQILGGCLEDEK
tara:strand:- start:1359 stop:1757 length:399 start_codon:yes stop_codon:yes gene_type:complete